MRQRLLDGGRRRDMVPPGSAAAQTELHDYCSGKGGAYHCRASVRADFRRGLSRAQTDIQGPFNSARCSSCNCDPTGSLIVLDKIKVGGFVVQRFTHWVARLMANKQSEVRHYFIDEGGGQHTVFPWAEGC